MLVEGEITDFEGCHKRCCSLGYVKKPSLLVDVEGESVL